MAENKSIEVTEEMIDLGVKVYREVIPDECSREPTDREKVKLIFLAMNSVRTNQAL